MENSKSSTSNHQIFLSSLTKILDFNGDLHHIRDMLSELDTTVEGMSLCPDGTVRKATITISNPIPHIFDEVYSLTFNNGVTIYSPPKSKILTSYEKECPVQEIKVGDVVQSGRLRYNNNEWVPSVITEFNIVTEVKKIPNSWLLFFEVESNMSNIFLGEEGDGETFFSCVK